MPKAAAPKKKTPTTTHKHPVCPIHGRELMCPVCFGTKGGSQKSAAKTRAARTNAKKWGDATCHPGRPVHSHGLCRSCYNIQWAREKRALKKAQE